MSHEIDNGISAEGYMLCGHDLHGNDRLAEMIRDGLEAMATQPIYPDTPEDTGAESEASARVFRYVQWIMEPIGSEEKGQTKAHRVGIRALCVLHAFGLAGPMKAWAGPCNLSLSAACDAMKRMRARLPELDEMAKTRRHVPANARAAIARKAKARHSKGLATQSNTQ